MLSKLCLQTSVMLSIRKHQHNTWVPCINLVYLKCSCLSKLRNTTRARIKHDIFPSFFPLSQINQITIATRMVWEKTHHSQHVYSEQQGASRTSIACGESTKDRKECKLPAVRKTRARDLRANSEFNNKNYDPKKMRENTMNGEIGKEEN